MNSTSMPVNKNTQLNRVMICLMLMVAIVSTNCTHTTQNTLRDPTSEKEERELAAALTEFNNCKTAQDRFPTLLSKDTVECTDDYLLYESKTLNKKKPENIKLGSFNIIRIGQAQTRFKRNDFVAQIINQWDLVTVVEIMTMGSESLAHNENIDTLAASLDASARDKAESSYEIPRYLPILAELRKMDPSWSLIMSPRGTGETTASYEYTGFFYRNGMIQNAKTAFCGDKRGCLTPISRENFENLVSRSPFVARFKSGKLDFNAAGLHLRFRAPANDCASGTAPKKGEKKCVDYSRAEKDIVNDYLKVSGKTKINKEDARYLELAVAHRVLETSPEDVLLMGDFNLEFKDRTKDLWKFAVGHEHVLVQEKTSISGLNGLANEYDHFVYVPKDKLAKCNAASAKSFNFILDLDNPTTDVPALKDLSQFMLKRKSKPADLLREFKDQIANQTMIESCTKKSCTSTSRYDEAMAKKLVCLYERNVLDKTDLKCTEETAEGEDAEEDSGASTAKKQPYKVYHELISDHIPIEMECSTK